MYCHCLFSRYYLYITVFFLQDDVKRILKEGKVDAANELVYGGKEHSRSYLVGRLIRKKEPKEKSARTRATTSSISNQFLESMTEKIRDQLAQEMEEKMEKVREKVMMLMSNLAEKNPELKIDIDEVVSILQSPNNIDDASEGNNDASEGNNVIP